MGIINSFYISGGTVKVKITGNTLGDYTFE